jgi:hypothetical protein
MKLYMHPASTEPAGDAVRRQSLKGKEFVRL